jgi:hypothetical protein
VSTVKKPQASRAWAGLVRNCCQVGPLPGLIDALLHLAFQPDADDPVTTSLAARACGVADRKGRILRGYDADLLAVAGDPIADLHAVLACRPSFAADGG